MPSPFSPRSVAVRALLAIAFIAVVGLGAYLLSRTRPNPDEPPVAPRLTHAELLEGVGNANAGIGLLENEKFGEADTLLSQAAERLPNEPLLVRNLAIGRVLNLESPQASVPPDQVQQALARLAEVEPNSGVTYWLAGRAQLKLHEQNLTSPDGVDFQQSGWEQLRLATQKEPERASFWYQLYESLRDASDESLKAESVAALDRAYQLAPGNLRVVIDWLYAHASAKDAAMASELPRIRQLLEPLAPSVQRRTNAKLLEYLDRLEAGVAKNDWTAARGAATAIRNFLISEEVTRSDGRDVLKNPLEFVLYQFRPEIEQQLAQASQPATPTPIDVRFERDWQDVDALQEVLDASIVDFNLDGRAELILLKATSLDVYRLEESGGVGDRLSSTATPAGMTKLLIADLDRDTVATVGSVKASKQQAGADDSAKPQFYEADPDVVVYGEAGVQVLRNELAEDGTTRSLELVPQDPAFGEIKSVKSAVLVDLDHEGDLDLVMSTDRGVQIWWNRDTAEFESATQWSQLPAEPLVAEHLVVVDWDRDVDNDLLLVGGSLETPGWLENLRHGQVRWRPLADAFEVPSPISDALVWEANGDASWDLLLAGPDGIRNVLTKTIPAQSVLPQKMVTISERGATSVRALDFDNDGRQDLLVAAGDSPPRLFRGTDAGSEEVAGVLPADFTFDPVTLADADHDGDIDVLARAGDRLVLLRNEGGNRNHWLTVRVRGEAAGSSGRVNHFGLGSLLELKTGGRYQAAVVAGQQTHFGLGTAERADVLRVLFTNGIPQSVIRPQADQLVSELMINKTSCPFLYAWNGKQFEFVTDLLWNAPLGLQLADGVIAPDRPWEYLKVRGDQLREREGAYELQVTCELWEADYFDQVELIAIDHPASVEVYSNEKVGPPEIAERHVHTVDERRPLAGATDSAGRDLAEELAQADGVMAVPFQRTLRKGRAEPHYLELDFGDVPAFERMTLFLTGWIQPGDTSLSVAASHNLKLPPGEPPSLWAPDAEGKWIQTVPFMGFPGGKPKTIAVDVSNAFRGPDRRLRLATNFELYWDEAFFTIDDGPVELREHATRLVSADLHYRGFSAVTPYSGSQPETYDYQQLDRHAHWPPMHGRFTRYGDVTPLVANADRQLVVLGSGDEMTLRFEAPPPPPAGWTRDFLLHSIGWDKDADLNTVLGQTVEPLPYVGMPGYPYESDFVSGAGADGLREYLRKYQTRGPNASSFWSVEGLPQATR